jgi:oligopeptidase B
MKNEKLKMKTKRYRNSLLHPILILRTSGYRTIIFFLLLTLVCGCNRLKPPVAQQIPSEQVVQGIHLTDPYKWMENTKDPKTIAYINAENEYADHYLDRIDLKNRVLKEFEERDEFADKWGTNPVLTGDYFYFARITPGKDYPIHYRKLNVDNAKEESFLDENVLSNGSSDYKMKQFLSSPDNSCYLFSYTLNGIDRLIIQSFDGKTSNDSIIASITYALWAQDGKSVIYVKDKKEVFVHKLHTPASQDLLIYDEKRMDLDVDINLSGSGKYIFVKCSNAGSDEYSYFPADLKTMKPMLIEPYKEGTKYFPNHFGSDFFLILSDQDSGTRKLYKAMIDNPSAKNWSTVLEGNDSIYINDFTVIDQKYLLLIETRQMNARMRLIDLSYGGKDNQITFREPDGHIEFNYFNSKAEKIVFSFASLLTPYTTYNYDINTRELIIGRPPLVKDYQKENYITETVWVKAADGTLIPVSMVHKNGMKRSDGKNPLYLEAFGSYGLVVQSDFTSARLSLLDRGFYLAVAHIRGGGEFGRKWWESGKLLNKKTAINDYLSCAEFLVEQGYTAKGTITATGSYEGGTVIGAAVNQRPDLFKSVLLLMPDMDMVADVLDSSVNTINHDKRIEYGNPANRQQFEYLHSYSPYDNTKKQEYPAMLFRSSLGCQLVECYGALKMVAKLRSIASGKNIFLIKTSSGKLNMGNYREKEDEKFWAENWAFILKQYGIEE